VGLSPDNGYFDEPLFCCVVFNRYTNLIEITRPTVAGNVPGFRTAVASVQDRSKPFVGALVLEQLYGKFQDRWIVELLFDVRSICLHC
jgi:hypothetical protein